jgi:hypothetical protein
VEEFALLLPGHDPQYESFLNEIWNNKASFHERTRYGRNQKIDIPFPIVNMLGGVQPSHLGELPPSTWASGLSRRFMMIYSAEQQIKDPFLVTVDVEELKEAMLEKLAAMSELQGEITWEPTAMIKFRNWVLGGEPIKPTHPKLEAYNTNRRMNIIKLAGISTVSRGKFKITLFDVERAFRWAFEAEESMPDIFRAMIGKSDQDIIDELYRAVAAMYRANGSKPVDKGFVYYFVSTRTTSEKVERIIDLADKMGAVVRIAGTDTFMPKPKWNVKQQDEG